MLMRVSDGGMFDCIATTSKSFKIDQFTICDLQEKHSNSIRYVVVYAQFTHVSLVNTNEN